MRGLTPRERVMLTDVRHCMRAGGGLHLTSTGDRIVAGRLVRRGALHRSHCGNEEHYTLGSLANTIIELDRIASTCPERV